MKLRFLLSFLMILLFSVSLALPCAAADSAEPGTGDAMLLVMLISVGTTALMFLVITIYAKIVGRKKK